MCLFHNPSHARVKVACVFLQNLRIYHMLNGTAHTKWYSTHSSLSYSSTCRPTGIPSDVNCLGSRRHVRGSWPCPLPTCRKHRHRPLFTHRAQCLHTATVYGVYSFHRAASLLARAHGRVVLEHVGLRLAVCGPC